MQAVRTWFKKLGQIPPQVGSQEISFDDAARRLQDALEAGLWYQIVAAKIPYGRVTALCDNAESFGVYYDTGGIAWLIQDRKERIGSPRLAPNGSITFVVSGTVISLNPVP